MLHRIINIFVFQIILRLQVVTLLLQNKTNPIVGTVSVSIVFLLVIFKYLTQFLQKKSIIFFSFDFKIWSLFPQLFFGQQIWSSTSPLDRTVHFLLSRALGWFGARFSGLLQFHQLRICPVYQKSCFLE